MAEDPEPQRGRLEGHRPLESHPAGLAAGSRRQALGGEGFGERRRITETLGGPDGGSSMLEGEGDLAAEEQKPPGEALLDLEAQARVVTGLGERDPEELHAGRHVVGEVAVPGEAAQEARPAGTRGLGGDEGPKGLLGGCCVPGLEAVLGLEEDAPSAGRFVRDRGEAARLGDELGSDPGRAPP
jgi:hypothetical protein